MAATVKAPLAKKSPAAKTLPAETSVPTGGVSEELEVTRGRVVEPVDVSEKRMKIVIVPDEKRAQGLRRVDVIVMNDKASKATRGELAGAMPGDLVEVKSERGIQSRLGQTTRGPRMFYNLWLSEITVLEGERIDAFDVEDPDAGIVHTCTVCQPFAGESIVRRPSDKLAAVRVRLDVAAEGEEYVDLCFSPSSAPLLKAMQALTAHTRIQVRGNAKAKEYVSKSGANVGKTMRSVSIWVAKLRTTNVPDAPEGRESSGGKEYIVEVAQEAEERGLATVLFVAAAGDPEAPLLEALASKSDTAKAAMRALKAGDIVRVLGNVKPGKVEGTKVLWINEVLGEGVAPSPDSEPSEAQNELYSAEVHADGTEAPPGTDDAPDFGL